MEIDVRPSARWILSAPVGTMDDDERPAAKR